MPEFVRQHGAHTFAIVNRSVSRPAEIRIQIRVRLRNSPAAVVFSHVLDIGEAGRLLRKSSLRPVRNPLNGVQTVTRNCLDACLSIVGKRKIGACWGVPSVRCMRESRIHLLLFEPFWNTADIKLQMNRWLRERDRLTS
jgi:hypothetical protein